MFLTTCLHGQYTIRRCGYAKPCVALVDLHAGIFTEFFKWLTSSWKLTNEKICYIFVFVFVFLKWDKTQHYSFSLKLKCNIARKSIETWKHTVKGTLKVSHKSAVFQKQPFIRLFLETERAASSDVLCFVGSASISSWLAASVFVSTAASLLLLYWPMSSRMYILI